LEERKKTKIFLVKKMKKKEKKSTKKYCIACNTVLLVRFVVFKPTDDGWSLLGGASSGGIEDSPDSAGSHQRSDISVSKYEEKRSHIDLIELLIRWTDAE